MAVLTVGNSAKLYCLNWIEDYLTGKSGTVRLLDLGCGTGNNFVTLLHNHPNIHYVGLDPSPEGCAGARQNLAGLDAEIINSYAYNVYDRLGQKFDLVVSFSVLEHVYQREAYMRAAKECMASGAYFLINYDSGHFVMSPGAKDRVKNVVGPLLARFGSERYHQSLVKEREFSGILERLGFKVLDSKFFNTRLKGVYKLIPETERPDYMEKWLSLELWLNESGLTYDDSKANTFATRNFILSL